MAKGREYVDSKAQEVEEAAKRNELAGADPGLIGREGSKL